MRTGPLVIGAIVLFVGLGIGLLCLSAAESMGYWEREEGDYAAAMMMAFIGFIVAGIGAAIVLWGLASKHSKPSPQQVVNASTDTQQFCAYCGTPLKGAVKCMTCGRSVPK